MIFNGFSRVSPMDFVLVYLLNVANCLLPMCHCELRRVDEREVCIEGVGGEGL